MIYKKTLLKNLASSIDKDATQIKVINSQYPMMLRVFDKQSRLVLDSEVRAGFEMEILEGFSKIMLTSIVNQEAELWVSKIKLGYDAPTAGANNNISSLFFHYGDKEELASFEPNRVRMMLVSDTHEFWYGGQDLDISNGIKAEVGEKVIIEGAGAVSAILDIEAEYSIDSVDVQVDIMAPDTGKAPFVDTPYGFFMVKDGDLYRCNKSDSAWQQVNEVLNAAFQYRHIAYYNGKVWGFGTSYSVFHSYDPETLVKTDYLISAALSVIYDVRVIDGNLCAKTIVNNRNQWRNVFNQQVVFLDCESGYSINSVSDGVFITYSSRVYFFDTGSLPAVIDSADLVLGEELFSIQGTQATMQVTENEYFYVFSSKSINAQVFVVEKTSKVAQDFGYVENGFATSGGVVTISRDTMKEWVHDGNAWSSSVTVDMLSTYDANTTMWALFKYDKFYMVGTHGILQYDAVKKRDNPKSKIRMLKSTV